MKKFAHFFVFYLLIVPIHLMDAKIGCMDNSYHLKQKFDPKTYHFVQCNCPCEYFFKDSSKCRSCGHTHLARKETIISTVGVGERKATKTFEPELTVATITKELIKKYKARK